MAAAHPAPPAAAAGRDAPPARPSGTPYGLGLARGNQEKAAIVRLLRRYADLPEQALAELDFPAGGAEDVIARLDTDSMDELQGIADAVEVPLANVAAINFVLAAVMQAASMPRNAHGTATGWIAQGSASMPWRRGAGSSRDCAIVCCRSCGRAATPAAAKRSP